MYCSRYLYHSSTTPISCPGHSQPSGTPLATVPTAFSRAMSQIARHATLSFEPVLPLHHGGEQDKPVGTETPNITPNNVEDKFRDPYGPRLGKAARFWKTYVQESNTADDELSKGWNQMLDVLLIFAALFSSICTTFALDSLKYLKADQAGRTTDTLVLISQSLMAMSNQSIPAPTATPAFPSTFTPPKYAVAVSTLWFFSLILSITVTFVSILAKEWCHLYMAGRIGPVHDQARRRQQRFDGLKRWRMVGLIAFLPTLLHIALFIFAIGLSIYLWNIYPTIAAPVIALTIVTGLLYLAVTILPFVYEFCPYSTALSRLFINLWFKSRKPSAMGGALDDNIPMDMVTSKALSWVISNSQNTKSVDTALQAIAGADHSLPCEPLWNCNAAGLVQQRLHDCFTSQELPVTNSGFETLVKLGSGNLTFRLCVLYARVLNVLAWDGTKDGWNQSINVFRDVWSEFELLFDNLARHSGSEIAPSTTVGYAGISVWKQHKPYIISSFSRGTESPLGVSAYILLVLERHGDLPSYEAQLFELFYVLHRGLIDHDASDPVYKRDLVTNLVSILKHLTCDSLLMDFSYVAQVFGSAGLILNGHHSPPDSLADKVGRYGEFEKIEPELLLFLGLIGLVEVSDSIGTELGEDIHPAVDLGIVFERLVQLKIFLVSNTQGSWPPTDLPLPFPLGRVSTFNDYGLNVISNYYRLHANATTSSQKRCVGLAGGIIVGSVVGNDCILDHWRPMVTDALPLLEDSSASLRWSYPNTPCHPTLRTRAPFLDVSFFAVLSLMKHNTKEYAQRQCLAACFHEIADQIQRVSQESREPIANELIQKTMEYDLFDVLVQALLTIRHDCPSTKPWRGIYAEPKLGWWGARLLELAHQSAHQQDNMGNGVGDVGSAIETFCLTEITPNTKTAFELTPDTDAMPEYSTEKASASANSFIMRLAQFKSVLLAEMRNPTDISDDPIEEVLEESTGDLKPSWSTRLQRTRRKLTIRPSNSHTELV